jgi:hypothetical protein
MLYQSVTKCKNLLGAPAGNLAGKSDRAGLGGIVCFTFSLSRYFKLRPLGRLKQRLVISIPNKSTTYASPTISPYE